MHNALTIQVGCQLLAHELGSSVIRELRDAGIINHLPILRRQENPGEIRTVEDINLAVLRCPLPQLGDHQSGGLRLCLGA